MDSFLSGFSHSYGGTQVGQGYAGNVGAMGNTNSSASQSVDVAQLQPGDTFQGEIVSVNGEDVQIELANGQYMAAKLERDVQLAIGQVLNLQVQSNKDNRIVLKPVYDNNAQMLRVGEAALRAAHLAVNDKTLSLVSKLLENGMSIDKNTLMNFHRLSLQNPEVELADIIKLNKLQLPVTESNLTQLHNYQNMEHKLLDGVREAADAILNAYDTLINGKSASTSPRIVVNPNTAPSQMSAGNTGAMENVNVVENQSAVANQISGTGQNMLPGQTALENGVKFMEQVLSLLTDEEQQGTVSSNQQISNLGTQTKGEDGFVKNDTSVINSNISEGKAQQQADAALQAHDDQGRIQQEVENQKQQGRIQQEAPQAEMKADIKALLGQLKSEKAQNIPDKLITLINDGKLDLKGMKQLLSDSGEFGRLLTAEQKAAVFRSEPFREMLKNGLQKQWTLTPQELSQQGKVEEFYQKLMKESSQLSRMMNEAMQESGQNTGGAQARAMANISENVEFINQMNQMFNYVQLPLKLSNSQAHGDLYVYTNKKNMAHRDGMLTAFLHLDMDHLGSLDVSISLQTEKNQVTTKFYLNEDSIALVEEHIGELTQRLSRKGYQCKSMVVEKDEDKTVLEHLEEQKAGTNAVLSYQTFDTRA